MSESESTFVRICETVLQVVSAVVGQPEETGLIIKSQTSGELLRLARAERGMSVADLARKTGISEIKIGWYERQGERFWKPSFDELIAIKAALGIHPDSIRNYL